MAEFKSMTVQALRDLARKALGRGHSKFKTKAQLIEALQAAEKRVAGAVDKAAAKVKAVTGKAARASGKMSGALQVKGRAARKGAKAPRPGAGATPPGTAKERPVAAGRVKAGQAKAGQAAREAVRAVREVAAAVKEGARRAREVARGEPEPDPEGYMVARVAGEDAVRGAPHPMTESALEAHRGRPSHATAPGPRAWPGGYDEQLGELPWSYGDDALIALPRDPNTLFLYWDHADDTLRTAFRDLDGGRAQLWVFARGADGRWRRVRTIDFALESRSYYVHDLEANLVYRAEIHVVDRHGTERLLALPSNETMLPPVGPSPIVDDRFMRILWGEPLQRVREARPGAPFPDDVRAQLARLSDWSRFAGQAWGSSAGGMGGRPFSPTSSPSAPSSPASPWARTDPETR